MSEGGRPGLQGTWPKRLEELAEAALQKLS